MKFLGNSAEFVPGAEIWLDRFFRRRTPPTPLPDKIVAVGHRGTKTHAPENTIAAHEKAYKLGARCIEFDVRCTKDGHFIVFHDRDVTRTTDGKGDVENLTLAEIKAFDAGSHKSRKFAGERVPTLFEALTNVRGRYAVDIDFKSGPKHSAAMINEILEATGFKSSNAPLVTVFARIKDFEILTPLADNYALRPHYLGRRHARKMARHYDLKVMGLRRYSFSMAAARNIRIHDMHLFSNVMGRGKLVDKFDDALNAGSLFIQTDHLDELVPYLATKNKLETGVIGRNFRPIINTAAIA